MGCTNCDNNCTDITSDKCVKYTGNDISILGIESGDSLLVVTNALTEFLVSTLDGTGIKPTIDPEIICELVTIYLPEGDTLTLNDILSALIQSVCSLQEQINTIDSTLTTLNANYTLSCLSGVTYSSGTHAIVQAVINKLCSVNTILTALALNITNNYVSTSNINALIQAYLNSLSASDNMYNKMIPYVAVEYYGPLTGIFDATGAGIGTWEKIYLCNGMNGTPDKRGRIGIGCTNMSGTVALDAAVNPSITGNPTYSLTSPGVSTKYGANSIILSAAQLAAHTHIATSPVTEDPHYHFEFTNDSNYGDIVSNINSPIYINDTGGDQGYDMHGKNTIPTLGKTSSVKTNLTVNTTNENSGSGEAHSNIQPVLATYYIIYLP